jgi:hypothetical protein
MNIMPMRQFSSGKNNSNEDDDSIQNEHPDNPAEIYLDHSSDPVSQVNYIV